jgi:hypothetical protein
MRNSSAANGWDQSDRFTRFDGGFQAVVVGDKRIPGSDSAGSHQGSNLWIHASNRFLDHSGIAYLSDLDREAFSPNRFPSTCEQPDFDHHSPTCFEHSSRALVA